MSDVLIIGAGYIGLISALFLRQSGFNVCIFEKNSKDIKRVKIARNFSISNGTLSIFRKYNISLNEEKFGQKIDKINVSDLSVDKNIILDPKVIGFDSFGYMFDENVLITILQDQIDKFEIPIIYNSNIIDIHSDENFAYLTNHSDTLKSKLVIVADGKNSSISYDILNIGRTVYNYNQIGVVGTVMHKDFNHNGFAIERFFENGLVALLPTKNKNKSSMVWTVDSSLKASFKNLNKVIIAELLQSIISDVYGSSIEIISDLISYDLLCISAKSSYKNRVALVGDANRSIHPLAGQGLNLGIRDIDDLLSLIIKQKDIGLDIGSILMLQQYEKIRKIDSNKMIFSTDILNSIFSNKMLSMRFVRTIGFDIFKKTPFLKKIVMLYGMGYS